MKSKAKPAKGAFFLIWIVNFVLSFLGFGPGAGFFPWPYNHGSSSSN